jgi:hypothetical protein
LEKLRINRVRQVAQYNRLPYPYLPKELHRLQTFQRANCRRGLFDAIQNCRKRPRSKLDRDWTRSGLRLLSRCRYINDSTVDRADPQDVCANRDLATVLSLYAGLDSFHQCRLVGH